MDWNSIKSVVIPEGNVKQIAKGSQILWKAGGVVPSYTELQWIESDGTSQVINTNIPISNIAEFEIRAAMLSTANNRGLCGGKEWHIRILKSTGSDISRLRIYSVSSGSTVYKNIYQNDTTVHTIRATETAVYLDGTKLDDIPKSTTDTGTMRIFRWDTTTAATYGRAQLYYFQAKDTNGNLLIDLIPVRKNDDNDVCLYDKVSKTFFGTGYEPGPDKNK